MGLFMGVLMGVLFLDMLIKWGREGYVCSLMVKCRLIFHPSLSFEVEFVFNIIEVSNKVYEMAHLNPAFKISALVFILPSFNQAITSPLLK